jgi:hypothetical protein
MPHTRTFAMACPRPLRILPLLLALAACSDDPTGTPPLQPPAETAKVLGGYTFTISGIGTPDMRASIAPVSGGPGFALNPRNSGLAYEAVSSSTFTEGSRGKGGQRYVIATYRVRNSTGAPVSNLTLIPSSTTSTTFAGTPFIGLTRFDGSPADPALASQFVPTGAATLGAANVMRATDVDVLQVFQESEIAAIPLPEGITGLFPYGFMVRSATSATDRTLAPAATASEFGGLVTFAFRYPLPSSPTQDPFQMSFHAIAVEDMETRLTESIEEGQDTSAVRRLRERAAALGATTVTVLAGSSAASPDVPDYPGQRQICTVRTAGAAAAPTRYITAPAAYTRISLRRPGESNSACGAYFRSGTPAALTPGTAANLTVVAMDRYGNVRTDVDSIQLERVSGPTATLGARTALVGGEATIPVTYSAYGSSVLRAVGSRIRTEHPIEVGTPSVTLNAGSWQAAMAGTAVPAHPSVIVRDPAGNPMPGRTVTFSVASGDGAVTGGVATTDAAGVATVGGWLLGAAANLNTLTATVSGSGVIGSPVTFSAAGCEGGGGTGYAITVCFTSAMTASQRAAFQSAAARWQGLVTGDLPDMAIDQPAGFCSTISPALNLTVDDLLIFAAIQPIDGPGGTLGSAGPCRIRSPGNLSFVGVMRFDAADMVRVEDEGRLGSLILHEMGHVLGVGSLWPYFSLLQNPSSAGSTLDTYYSGANGITGFNNVGGATYTGGQKVPVENTGGSGTMNGHWRESVLASELMTGYLGTTGTPISELTVRSLADMGYAVNVAGADPFFLTLTLRGEDALNEPGLRLIDDIWQGPIYQVDAQGRATLLR